MLAALRAEGASVSEARQHLARPFGARYCSGAKTDHDIALSICEYADEASAAAGRTLSERALAGIPDREIALNGATTLTLRQTQKSPASSALTRRLLARFASLTK